MTEPGYTDRPLLLESSLRTAWVTWSVIFVAPVMMVLVVEFFGQYLQVLDERLQPGLGLRNVLLFASLLMVFLLQGFRRRMLTNMRHQHRDKGSPESELARLFGRYVSLILTVSAGAEMVAMIGLMLFLFGADKGMMYLFVGISLLALWVHRPREQELLDLGK